MTDGNFNQYIKSIVTEMAEKYSVREDVVASVIWQESGRGSSGDLSAASWAVRYEEGFFTRYIWQKKLTGYVPQNCHMPTERRMRAASFGLMQVLGCTARELGFRGAYIPMILSPRINIELGVRKLAACLKLVGGDYDQALLKYNGGANKNYSVEIWDHIRAGVTKTMFGEIASDTH